MRGIALAIVSCTSTGHPADNDISEGFKVCFTADVPSGPTFCLEISSIPERRNNHYAANIVARPLMGHSLHKIYPGALKIGCIMKPPRELVGKSNSSIVINGLISRSRFIITAGGDRNIPAGYSHYGKIGIKVAESAYNKIRKACDTWHGHTAGWGRT